MLVICLRQRQRIRVQDELRGSSKGRRLEHLCASFEWLIGTMKCMQPPSDLNSSAIGIDMYRQRKKQRIVWRVPKSRFWAGGFSQRAPRPHRCGRSSGKRAAGPCPPCTGASSSQAPSWQRPCRPHPPPPSRELHFRPPWQERRPALNRHASVLGFTAFIYIKKYLTVGCNI